MPIKKTKVEFKQRADDPGGPKILYIMRGIPGSGKSTWAKEKLRKHIGDFDRTKQLDHILSTDDYFTTIDPTTKKETYKFNGSQIKNYHRRNKAKAAAQVIAGITPLFIDNTNTTVREMRPYVALAKEHGYQFKLVGPETYSSASNNVYDESKFVATSGWNKTLLLERNVIRGREIGKDIPEEAIDRMIARYKG